MDELMFSWDFPFPLFFLLVAVIVLGVLVFNIIEFFKNQSAPEEIVTATLIDKVTETSHSSAADNGSGSSNTYYTLTFELNGNERKSFNVSRKSYLKYVVGDSEKLHYQRKRFNHFELDTKKT